MTAAARQIFAFSGVLDGEPGQPDSFALVWHAVRLAARGGRTRVCYVPTAIGGQGGHAERPSTARLL